MAEQSAIAASGMPAAGLPAVIELFNRACEAFLRSLGRTDEMLDATDFTGSIHELGYTAGRLHALGEALSLLTGRQEWTRQAEEVLAEYMLTTSPTEQGA